MCLDEVEKRILHLAMDVVWKSSPSLIILSACNPIITSSTTKLIHNK